MENRQSGFTLVELIVVILILGVLSATALPRFINLNDKAYKAAVTATGGALGTAVSLAKAQWIANGHSAFEDDLDGFGDGTVDVSANGWPVGTTLSAPPVTPGAAQCLEVWNGVLSNPPAAAISATNEEYEVAYDSGTTTCTYTYQRATGYSIAYNTANGNVTVTAP